MALLDKTMGTITFLSVWSIFFIGRDLTSVLPEISGSRVFIKQLRNLSKFPRKLSRNYLGYGTDNNKHGNDNLWDGGGGWWSWKKHARRDPKIRRHCKVIWEFLQHIKPTSIHTMSAAYDKVFLRR